MEATSAPQEHDYITEGDRTIKRTPRTNLFSLTPSSTVFVDRLWQQNKKEVESPSFVEKYRRICHGTRFSAKVFEELPGELDIWPGWKHVSSELKDCLPQFHAMLEYVVRRIFKVLFNKDSNTMFQWFIDRCAREMTLTKVLIEAIKRCKKGSAEKRVLQAVVHSSFSREDLKCILKEHDTLLEDFHAQEGGGQSNGSAGTTREDDVTRNNSQPRRNSEGCEPDDDILNVMSSDEEEDASSVDEEETGNDNGRGGDEDGGLMPDLFDVEPCENNQLSVTRRCDCDSELGSDVEDHGVRNGGQMNGGGEEVSQMGVNTCVRNVQRRLDLYYQSDEEATGRNRRSTPASRTVDETTQEMISVTENEATTTTDCTEDTAREEWRSASEEGEGNTRRIEHRENQTNPQWNCGTHGTGAVLNSVNSRKDEEDGDEVGRRTKAGVQESTCETVVDISGEEARLNASRSTA